MPERVARRYADPFLSLREGMDNMFHRFFGDWRFPEEWVEMPEWEVKENENEVVMRLEVPGFEANEINLTVEGNEMLVRAEHAVKEGEKAREGHRYEYRFTLPFGTDANHVEASYRSGVLELHLPRLEEAKPRKVEVKT
jgi:HSP20 family protein